ncbi:hypothetical protein BDW60DRAFT_179096 [Aspergillus nidulans var. acristatus]
METQQTVCCGVTSAGTAAGSIQQNSSPAHQFIHPLSCHNTFSPLQYNDRGLLLFCLPTRLMGTVITIIPPIVAFLPWGIITRDRDKPSKNRPTASEPCVLRCRRSTPRMLDTIRSGHIVSTFPKLRYEASKPSS